MYYHEDFYRLSPSPRLFVARREGRRLRYGVRGTVKFENERQINFMFSGINPGTCSWQTFPIRKQTLWVKFNKQISSAFFSATPCPALSRLLSPDMSSSFLGKANWQSDHPPSNSICESLRPNNSDWLRNVHPGSSCPGAVVGLLLVPYLLMLLLLLKGTDSETSIQLFVCYLHHVN